MTTVIVPGRRELRASLDGPEDAPLGVVACPPHPELGGNRHDRRLVAVADALAGRGIACLRMDYGPYDEGRAEVEDCRRAVARVAEHCDRIGLFGYSFGAGVVLLAAGGWSDTAAGNTAPENSDGEPASGTAGRRLPWTPDDAALVGVSALAPPASLSAGQPVPPHLEAIRCPVQVLVGERDTTVDSGPVAACAREAGHAVRTLSADHFFIGQDEMIATAVAEFFADVLEADEVG